MDSDAALPPDVRRGYAPPERFYFLDWAMPLPGKAAIGKLSMPRHGRDWLEDYECDDGDGPIA